MDRVSAHEVIASRCGAVLGRQTVLKDDHFPGCQNKKLTPLIEGAPNFRQVDGLPVYGVAIPTVTGLRNVLEAVGGKARKALWHSMREEPLVYINGQPYVLREVEKPFSNLELTGITRERVEQMEARLREDVLAEAEQYGGRVLVSKELDDGQVIDTWEPVHTVQTPLEVCAALTAEGYQLSYVRIPITDEKVCADTLARANIHRAALLSCRSVGCAHANAAVHTFLLVLTRAQRHSGAQGCRLRRDSEPLRSRGRGHSICGQLPDGQRPHNDGHDHLSAGISASTSAPRAAQPGCTVVAGTDRGRGGGAATRRLRRHSVTCACRRGW